MIMGADVSHAAPEHKVKTDLFCDVILHVYLNPASALDYFFFVKLSNITL
jgi:hypothetical protein